MNDTREMLRRSWRAWLHHGSPRVGPPWIDHLWTVVFALVIAALFSIVGLVFSVGNRWVAWPKMIGGNVLISLSISFAVRASFWLGRRAVGSERLAHWSTGRRWLYFTFVPIAGVAVGWPLGMWAAGQLDPRFMAPLQRPDLLWTNIVAALLITALFQQFFRSKSRQISAEDSANEARLRLLQAQIEPHFLFNTLANVVSLMEVDAPRAKSMLEAFVDYLRASLSGFGEGRHTLRDELELITAYLRILKIRMEDRLEYAIEVPPSLLGLSMPALTLQPLVENAIVHGLEPHVAGGHVRIGARLEGASLVMTVADDGAGLREAPLESARRAGSGTALANIRHRLQQAYGSRASLDLRAAEPRGVCACLSLPVAA